MAKDQHLKPSSWFPVLFHDIPIALGKAKSSMWKTHVFPQDRLETCVFPYAVGQIPLFPWLTHPTCWKILHLVSRFYTIFPSRPPFGSGISQLCLIFLPFQHDLYIMISPLLQPLLFHEIALKSLQMRLDWKCCSGFFHISQRDQWKKIEQKRHADHIQSVQVARKTQIWVP